VCLLITLYVRHELSYDDFHEDADRIYRVVTDWESRSSPSSYWPAIQTIKEKNPALPVAPFVGNETVVTRETQRFNERVFIAQPSFFDVFTFPLRTGSAAEALEEPRSVVLAPSVAEKYFGDQNPVGKTLEVNGLMGADRSLRMQVTGVLEPIPHASHFHPKILLSWATVNAVFDFDEHMRDNWGSYGFRAYLKIPEGASPDQLAGRFTEQVKKKAPPGKPGGPLRLQALTNIHLHSDMEGEIEPNGSIAYVYLFSVVAVFVLVLACVNYVNLATARASERAREIGVRKTVGAVRSQIAGQFLAESSVLSGLALVGAVGLVAGALPLFRTLTDIPLRGGVLTDPFTIGALLVITALTILGAGGYPAFILSRFDPVEVLGGRSQGGGGQRGSPTLRKGLVVFQFAVSVVLIAGTLVAYWQLDYLQSARLGFDQERVVTLPRPPAASSPSASQSFRSEVANQAGVTAVSRASAELPSQIAGGSAYAFDGLGIPESERRPTRVMAVGYDFFETLGVDSIAGRTFERGRGTDSSAVVLNRTAYERLIQDLPADQRSMEDAIGRALSAQWPVDKPKVIGVVEDFHVAPLETPIEPVAFFLPFGEMGTDTFYLRTGTDPTSQVLSNVREVWNRFFPDAPFAYSFVDQSFEASYRTERRLGTLFGVFAGLAIFIAGLGLFGLAAFTARQRQQEIGIRKAVGASVLQIVRLLSTDFAALVGVAIVVAVPVAYVGLNRWLDTFAYRIDLGMGVFVLAGGSALLVALIAVGLQALRAAQTDPAEVLRSE
jgi:putative ABC transport system permease protein